MRLYWLSSRHNNQISVVIEPGPCALFITVRPVPLSSPICLLRDSTNCLSSRLRECHHVLVELVKGQGRISTFESDVRNPNWRRSLFRLLRAEMPTNVVEFVDAFEIRIIAFFE